MDDNTTKALALADKWSAELCRRHRAKLLFAEADDVQQAGRVAALESVRNYDPEKGAALATYLYWPVRGAIATALRGACNLIRLPVSRAASRAGALTDLRAGMSPEEAAEKNNLTLDHVRALGCFYRGVARAGTHHRAPATPPDHDVRMWAESLSEEDKTVAGLLVEGYSLAEIAERLDMSKSGVHRHVNRLRTQASEAGLGRHEDAD